MYEWSEIASDWVDSGHNLTIWAPPTLTQSIAAGTWIGAAYRAVDEAWYALVVDGQTIYGKSDSLWTYGSPGTVSIYTFTSGAWYDSGIDVSAEPPLMIDLFLCPAGTWLELKWHAQYGKWIASVPTQLYGKVGTDWNSGSASVSVWANGADTTAHLTVAMPPWYPDYYIPAGSWLILSWSQTDFTWYASPLTAEHVESGVLDGDLVAGGSASMTVWAIPSTSTSWNDSEATGIALTVWAPMVQNITLPAGTPVVVRFEACRNQPPRFVVWLAQCSDSGD